jgi:hypothetical protein
MNKKLAFSILSFPRKGHSKVYMDEAHSTNEEGFGFRP